jgi:beta-mannosidase
MMKDGRAECFGLLPGVRRRQCPQHRKIITALALSVLISLLLLFDLFSTPATLFVMGWLQNWITKSEVFLAASGAFPSIQDLSTLKWTLSNQNGSISVPATIPSHAHLDLFKAGVIPDPYHGLNDFDLRWVAISNWTYSTTIEARKDSNSSWLQFNGLDTFADIYLCEKHVASTDNQFRQYYFDVSEIVRTCTKGLDLKIDFGSAAEIAKGIAEMPGQETWPEGVENVYEFRHRQFVRKEQSDFGWDWGPAFVPAGVWQPAFLVQLGESSVHVRNSLVDIYRQDQLPLLPADQKKDWVMNASIDFIGRLPDHTSLVFELMDLNSSRVVSGSLINVTHSENTVTGSTTVPAEKFELWWPVGFGKQSLYDLKIEIFDSQGTSIAIITKRVGFRTILLNQEPIRPDQLEAGTAPGANWHFEINGHEFYAKGSNMIPPDAFWPRVTKQKVQQLFDAAIVGNQNMLRVWSSGAYLPDFMYDMADAMGLLLWSEFEFGCAGYPANPEFLENVKHEAHYQVRRINHHPSLALWAGGNEMENLVLPTARSGDPEKFPQYLAEYEKLFLDVLAVAVFSNSKSISYTPSSTSNGWAKLDWSKEQPITQRYWNTTPGEIYGNTDHYNYNYDAAFDFHRYPVGRFANEFGFHSMPSLQSWQQAVDPEDLVLTSPVVRLRTHHYAPGGLDTKNFAAADMGIGEMTGAAQLYYPTVNKSASVANFSSYCHSTQIFQADFYSSQIQFYRRGSGLPERQLGSLYWQLNDIWQAPTWAGIEYDGRWKVLHSIAQDRYKNVIISPFYDFGSDTVEIWVTSDLWSPANGTVNFTWYNWAGNKLDIKTNSPADLSVGPLNSTNVLHLANVKAIPNINNAVMYMEVTLNGSLPNSKTIQSFHHSHWFQPVPLSRVNLTDPGLSVVHLPGPKKFRIKATSAIAPWVWLDYPAGVLVYFEKNGFWLRKGEEIDVGYKVYDETDTTKGDWVKGVTVHSVWDLALPDK